MFEPINPTDPAVALRFELPGDWRRPAAAGSYKLYWRADDGFGQIHPRPTPGEVQEFYKVSYYTHVADASQQGGEDPVPLRWRALQHLAWRVDRSVEIDIGWWRRTLGTTPLRCLEIGCGHGEHSLMLQELGHSVVAVEPDPDARRVGQSRGLTIFDGTAEDLPEQLEGQMFDCLVIMHVLEHCIDPMAGLANAAALLRPGGLLVAEVPNNRCRGAEAFGEVWYWLDVPRHLNFFTPKSFEALVRACGFDAPRTEYSGYNRQFAKPWADSQARIATTLASRQSVSFHRYVDLLAKTAFARSEDRYDSMRILARRAAGDAVIEARPMDGTAVPPSVRLST